MTISNFYGHKSQDATSSISIYIYISIKHQNQRESTIYTVYTMLQLRLPQKTMYISKSWVNRIIFEETPSNSSTDSVPNQLSSDVGLEPDRTVPRFSRRRRVSGALDCPCHGFFYREKTQHLWWLVCDWFMVWGKRLELINSTHNIHKFKGLLEPYFLK